MPAAKEAHHTHKLFGTEFGDTLAPELLVLCVRCGAHGTHRVHNLAKPCPAAEGKVRGRACSYRKQASLAERGLHPSLPGRVELRSLWPLACMAKAGPQPLQPQHSGGHLAAGSGLGRGSLAPPRKAEGDAACSVCFDPALHEPFHRPLDESEDEAVLFDSCMGFDG